ncbi:MAG: hypothetical protein QXH61_07955 [Candidatus Nezhaarchaeales archaeon]
MKRCLTMGRGAAMLTFKRRKQGSLESPQGSRQRRRATCAIKDYTA